MNRILSIVAILFFLIGCNPKTSSDELNLYSNGQWIGAGVSYGPFRDGQAPGGLSPSIDELREDLHIISEYWKWIRVYGARGITSDILKIIDEDNLDIKVMLGAWIAKEEGNEQIKNSNLEEVDQAIYLANKFSTIVNSINIGNETMVFWSDHIVDINTMKEYIEYTSNRVDVPVSTADDFNFWNKEESKIIADISDFIIIHIHPLWAGVLEDKALEWVQRIYSEIQSFHPTKKIIIGETGWATKRHTQGLEAELMNGEASEEQLYNYYRDFTLWASKNKIPHHFFEIFDEKWKGGSHPDEAEKHWGIFYSNRKIKSIFNDGLPR